MGETSSPSFERQDLINLSERFRIGQPVGPESETLGIISDVELGPDSALFVADQRLQRVMVYDKNGIHRFSLDAVGRGPGEFLEPSLLATRDSLLAVLDRQLQRISVFRADDGEFLWSINVSVLLPQDFEWLPDDTFLFVAKSFDTNHQLVQTDSEGKVIREHIEEPLIDAEVPSSFVPPAGAVCPLGADRVIYANSWIYEFGVYNLQSAEFEWIRRYTDDMLRPIQSSVATRPGVIPAGVVAGIGCDGDLIILVTYDIAERTGIRYDILSTMGEPLSRLWFEGRTEEYIGRLGAMKARRLAAFRNRPYAQVIVLDVIDVAAHAR